MDKPRILSSREKAVTTRLKIEYYEKQFIFKMTMIVKKHRAGLDTKLRHLNNNLILL